MKAPEIVLLGGPNSGKTHFAGQLYGRLRRSSCHLTIRDDGGTPADLSALEDVLQCLAQGKAAEHTSTEGWAEVHLPIVNQKGKALDLRWPDYGGEQLRAVLETRKVSESWRERLIAASGWVLMIRLNAETTYPDALEKPGTLLGRPSAQSTRAGAWDANARLVELLQILLHVAGLGTVRRLETPTLAVLLSCYDELGGKDDDSPIRGNGDGEVVKSRPPNEEAPALVLARRLPLLASFIASNWQKEAVSVWGLSALGRLLTRSSEDEHFIDEGPEYQGWVIPPVGGQPDPDLTLPLDWLLEAM